MTEGLLTFKWAELPESATYAPDTSPFTPRQRQVMELIVAGQANKNVASAFGVSQRTVEVLRRIPMRFFHRGAAPG